MSFFILKGTVDVLVHCTHCMVAGLLLAHAHARFPVHFALVAVRVSIVSTDGIVIHGAHHHALCK
jgi:hypothetical protein